MTEKSNERVRSILTRLFLINRGAKNIKDNAKTATIDVQLNGRYPLYILEEVERHCQIKKYKCDWFTDSSLYVQMRYSSVIIKKI